MSAELKELEAHLAALEAFIKSPAHEGYLVARKYEIDQLREAILAVEPADRATEIEGFKLRGELRSQIEMLTTFEDARQTLKARIDETIERDNQLSKTIQ